MEKLSSNATLTFSKELTLKAMENHMITVAADPKETAKNVVDFYHTVLTSINGED